MRKDILDVYPDATSENQDWTKGSWGLPFDNADDLRAWLKSRGQSVRAFKQLPVYKLNVEKLPWLRDL